MINLDTQLNLAPPHPTAWSGNEYLAAVSRPQLPAFMKEKPEIWFYLIESEFTAARTRSDDVKYNATLRALDPDTLNQVTDIISSPPTTDKYVTLKNTIIKRVAESREKQINRLLNDIILGDKKPSQLLREMKTLAGNSVSEEMLHNLWVSRLPSTIRPLLIISDKLSLDVLAEMADRIIDSGTLNTLSLPGSTTAVAAVAPPRTRSHTPPRQTLEAQMTELQSAMAFCVKELLEMKKQHQQSHNEGTSRSRARVRPRSGSQDRNSRSSSQQGICYYHRRFGQDARRCTTPCNYTNTQNQGN